MAHDNDGIDEEDAFEADFQDDAELYDEEVNPEEEAFEEEDWDSFDEQDQGAEAAQNAPKKKSKMFNILLIGGSIVGALGIVLLQGGGGAGTKTEPLPPAAVVSAEETIAPAPKEDEAEASQGFLNNPKGMAALEDDMTKTLQNIDTQPPPPPPAQHDMPAYANQPQEVTENAAPPMPAAMTTPDGTELLESAPPEAAPMALPETAADMPRMPQASDLLKQEEPAMPEMTATADPGVPENDKMEQILNRLDKMEADMHDLRASGTQGVSTSAEQEKIAALEATVEELKTELNSLRKSSVVSTTPKPQILGSEVASETPVARPARAKARPASREELASWVLKGAQPGQAMVARDGSSEMQTVVIGDTLPGIGRITDVAYRDGRWVVEGTKGQIFQR